MRVIVIEDKVYMCPEKVFKTLIQKKIELDKDPEGYKKDWEMQDLIESLANKLKLVGVIEFQFQN